MRWAACALVGLGVAGGLAAEEAAGESAGRLGFVFDQRVHDAAVAAEKAKAARVAAGAADAPPAGVVRLPEYFVRDRFRQLDAREPHTVAERTRLAKQRYLDPVYQKTLGQVVAAVALVGNLYGGWKANDREAMLLYENDEQKRRNLDLRDLTELTALHAKLVHPAGDPTPKRKK